MAHLQQRSFVALIAKHLPDYFVCQRVLEVGSLDINGSVRSAFVDCRYTGIDVAEGRGVDIVCQGQNFDAPDGSFDHVISCEVMEHNPHWEDTFKNMIRLCDDGGLITMTCATTGRPEHGTTRTSPSKSPLTVELQWDYYRNLTQADFQDAIDMDAAFSRWYFGVNWTSYDLYFVGVRRGTERDSALATKWQSLVESVDGYLLRENSRKVCRYRSFAARYLGDRWFAAWRAVGRRLGSRLIAYVH